VITRLAALPGEIQEEEASAKGNRTTMLIVGFQRVRKRLFNHFLWSLLAPIVTCVFDIHLGHQVALMMIPNIGASSLENV
jgi:hypothetical protein